MPSRRRPKTTSAPAESAMSDAARFAQALRESEAADRRKKEAERNRKAAEERAAHEAAAHAHRLEQARAAHQRAVEQVREAKRTGRGVAAADEEWKRAKAELVELETGKPPAWAKPAAPSPEDVDGAGDDQHHGAE